MRRGKGKTIESYIDIRIGQLKEDMDKMRQMGTVWIACGACCCM